MRGVQSCFVMSWDLLECTLITFACPNSGHLIGLRLTCAHWSISAANMDGFGRIVTLFLVSYDTYGDPLGIAVPQRSGFGALKNPSLKRTGESDAPVR